MSKEQPKWIQAWRVVNEIDSAMKKLRKRMEKKFSVKLVHRHDQLQATSERIKRKYYV